MNDFSKQDALLIQTEHLKQWEMKLKPEIFNDLKEWAIAGNDCDNPYKVRRGCELDIFVHNWPDVDHL